MPATDVRQFRPDDGREMDGSARRRRFMAYLLWSLSVVGVAANIAIGLVAGWPTGGLVEKIVFAPLVLTFATVGLMLVVRLPANVIGWTFLAAGALGAGWTVTLFYTEVGLRQGWPATAYAAFVGQAIYFPFILCMVAFPLLLFPDGRAPSPAWRWLQWWMLATIAISVVLPLAVAESTTIAVDDLAGIPAEMTMPVDDPACGAGDKYAGCVRIENPILGSASVTRALNTPGGIAFGLTSIAVSLLGPAAAMIYRFRRSEGVERLQVKWLAFSALMAGIGLVIFYTVESLSASPPDWLAGLALLGALAIPVAAGMAIVRYRLYDIDRLIGRTVSYGLLAGLLAAVYASVVFLVGLIPFDSSVPVAVSTLAVAALFNPLRSRLQRALDRRFSRLGYDPQEVVDDFSSRMNDEVDIDALAGELLDVVDNTISPDRSGLWVRDHRP